MGELADNTLYLVCVITRGSSYTRSPNEIVTTTSRKQQVIITICLVQLIVEFNIDDCSNTNFDIELNEVIKKSCSLSLSLPFFISIFFYSLFFSPSHYLCLFLSFFLYPSPFVSLSFILSLFSTFLVFGLKFEANNVALDFTEILIQLNYILFTGHVHNGQRL